MLLLDLQNESLTCRIAPENGGSIYSFNYHLGTQHQHLLRPTWSESAYLITDFASWPLVPFSNRIKEGKFSFMGKHYQVPINYLGYPHTSHGHGWERPWKVESHTSTHCILSFAFNDPVIWPFPYTSRQEFILHDQSLIISLSLTNSGDQPMPAGLGLHPYFPKPLGTTLQATIKHLWEIDETVIPTQRVSAPAEYDFSAPKSLDHARLDHCFDGYKGVMQITWPHQPVGLKVTSSPNLQHFVVYTPSDKDFFCAEPVSHMPDAINRSSELSNGLKILNPGESLLADYRFEIIPKP
ncbi:MAG: aldose 1-epimerase [Pseudomonadota bacterium]